MREQTCTAFTRPPERCGRVDQCTRVLVETGGFDRSGRSRPIQHYVCARCRKRMRLPDYDVRVTRTGTIPLKRRD